MNGQTGKMCADDLADNPLYYTWFKRIYLIVQLIDFILGFLVLKRIDREVGFETFDFIVVTSKNPLKESSKHGIIEA